MPFPPEGRQQMVLRIFGRSLTLPQHLFRALLASGPGALLAVFERHGVSADRWPPPVNAAADATASPSHPDAVGPYRSPPDASADASVVFWNDDRTTMDLVSSILRDTFGIVDPEATMLMLSTHRDGFATVGTYPRADAERLAAKAMQIAQERGFPLRSSVEDRGPARRTGVVARWWRRSR